MEKLWSYSKGSFLYQNWVKSSSTHIAVQCSTQQFLRQIRKVTSVSSVFVLWYCPWKEFCPEKHLFLKFSVISYQFSPIICQIFVIDNIIRKVYLVCKVGDLLTVAHRFRSSCYCWPESDPEKALRGGHKDDKGTGASPVWE